ncbi:unnamed protein product [Malassezia sympodialis ATCC 42132]|uniref:uncharacterized protein n=1 Tax=Malassezia sympodialis (strain ATCC 42132) TaxID=1230383 RepID=UPI0002C1E71F|nr:uncharacterized protein MSY001_1017 [Malassezia sympodialis ATCC 42132]CCU98311.1 unnamed protein product [Malassezia sympodialis ATCC 42132]|eukprot:XP_018739626.1 uncharacterized protein MSY001_1017 [Malassezia sympodialis ATCC 42132]
MRIGASSAARLAAGALPEEVVKEAVHIESGKYYACKVISKQLMRGREHMVRNEITSMKRVSQEHPGVVSLVDYFETMNNLYLVTDLCQGGELFDRICERGNYYENDAAQIVRTVMETVEFLHSIGVVHRGACPMINEEKLTALSTTCGTPGYMAPEVFKKTGHGKPVDMCMYYLLLTAGAMGVITYFLLCGYTPFDTESNVDEIQRIIAGDYKFEPAIYWQGVSEEARDFIRRLLTVDPSARMTAQEALKHPWLARVPSIHDSGQKDLLPEIKKAFNAKATFRKAVNGIRMINRLRTETQEHQQARLEMEKNHRLANEEAEHLDQVWAQESAPRAGP